MSIDFNSFPIWFLFFFVVAVCVMIAYIIHRHAKITIGRLSIESERIEKKGNNDEIRLKIYAQVREYENYTGQIERILFKGFETAFEDMTDKERTIFRLFCQLMRRALEKQLMLDLVANGIAHMTESELWDYTQNKSEGYENRILNFLSSYNDQISPERDILKVVDYIDMHDLTTIYFTIYQKCVEIANKERKA